MADLPLCGHCYQAMEMAPVCKGCDADELLSLSQEILTLEICKEESEDQLHKLKIKLREYVKEIQKDAVEEHCGPLHSALTRIANELTKISHQSSGHAKAEETE